MELTPVERKFVLHWGEMGTRWGVNRVVAQVHALLLLSPEPVDAEEIAETLSVARSSVSTGLRELQGWGILRASHRLGDRREYFETLRDPWEAFRVILEERKRREIDPTIRVLREFRDEATGEGARAVRTRKRFEEFLEFFETADGWYRQIAALPRAPLRRVFKAGGYLRRLAGGAR
jgi:DNA-binding transcriptional regulator GbsR (MarR family)